MSPAYPAHQPRCRWARWWPRTPPCCVASSNQTPSGGPCGLATSGAQQPRRRPNSWEFRGAARVPIPRAPGAVLPLQHGGHAAVQVWSGGTGQVRPDQPGRGAPPSLRLRHEFCCNFGQPAARASPAARRLMARPAALRRCGTCWRGRGGTRRRRWRWHSAPTTFRSWMCPARCVT